MTDAERFDLIEWHRFLLFDFFDRLQLFFRRLELGHQQVGHVYLHG